MSENATTTKEAAPIKAAEKLDGLFVASVEQFQEWLMSPGHPSKAFEVFRNVMWALQFATKARSKLLMTLWYDLMDLMRATHNHRIREWTYEVLVEFTSMRHHVEIVRDNGGLCALREEYSREVGDFSVVSSGARIEVLTMLVRLTLFICHGVPELATPILLDPKIFAMIESVVFNDVLPKDFRRSVWQRYLKVSRFAETQQKRLQPLRVQQLRNSQQYTVLMRQQQPQVRMQQQQSSVDGLEHASSGQPETATQTMVGQVTEKEVIQQLQQQPFSQSFMEQQTSVSQQHFAEEHGEDRLQEAQERFWLGERVQTVSPDRQAQHLEQSQLSQLQTQRLQEAYRQEMLNEKVRERQQQLMQVQRSKTPQERQSQLAQYKAQRVNESGRVDASKEQVEAKQDLLELLLKVLSERSQENLRQTRSDGALSGNELDLEIQRQHPHASYQQQIPQQGTYAPLSHHQDLRPLEPEPLSQLQRREMAPPQQYQQNLTSYATRSQIPAEGQWTGFVSPQMSCAFAMPSSSQSQAAGLSHNEATRAKAEKYGGQRTDFSLRNYLFGEAQEYASHQRVKSQGRPLGDQGQLQRLFGGQTLRSQKTEENRWSRLQNSPTWNQTPLAQANTKAKAPKTGDAKRRQNRQNSETDSQQQETMLRILERRKSSESDCQRDAPRDRSSRQPELWQPAGRNVPRIQMKDNYIELPDDNEPENI